jgi:hypothetical protein
MRIVSTRHQLTRIVLVCCVHGDELFGNIVFRYFKNRLKKFPGLKIVLAHTMAMARNVRFIEDDLNRSFPGSPHGNLEARLAHRLVPHLQGIDYVLDIHTTTSDIQVTPIVVNYNDRVKRVINLCSSTEVARMSRPFGQKSLIGQVRNGVSMEFGKKYAESDNALQEVIGLVDNLLQGLTKAPRPRKIFYIDGTIATAVKLGRGVRNFEFIPKLGVYPFLLREKAYTTHQGFAATACTERVL